MRRKTAFTIVEILIVVVILGIVAAVALPKFSNASSRARASMLADDLRILRTQIAVFKGQHYGVAPGYPGCDNTAAPTQGAFVAYMTMSSTPDGQTAAPHTDGYRYGPYLGSIPENPFNHKTSVEIIGDSQAFPVAADDSHGWVYKPSTLTIRGDSPGTDDNGKSYFDY